MFTERSPSQEKQNEELVLSVTKQTTTVTTSGREGVERVRRHLDLDLRGGGDAALQLDSPLGSMFCTNYGRNVADICLCF
jgi:hypothetical protein